MYGEDLGYLISNLQQSEFVLDAYYTSVQMKKNRPGVLVTVLSKPDNTEKVGEYLFTHTTTFGIRKQTYDRTELDREIVTLETPYGEVDFKIGYMNDLVLKTAPEYEHVKNISEKENVPYHALYTELKQLGHEWTKKMNNIGE